MCTASYQRTEAHKEPFVSGRDIILYDRVRELAANREEDEILHPRGAIPPRGWRAEDEKGAL